MNKYTEKAALFLKTKDFLDEMTLGTKKTHKTPCCNAKFSTDGKGPIFLNTFNNKVQCARCGLIFKMEENTA